MTSNFIIKVNWSSKINNNNVFCLTQCTQNITITTSNQYKNMNILHSFFLQNLQNLVYMPRLPALSAVRRSWTGPSDIHDRVVLQPGVPTLDLSFYRWRVALPKGINSLGTLSEDASSLGEGWGRPAVWPLETLSAPCPTGSWTLSLCG